MVLAEILGFVVASLVMIKSGDYAVKSITAIGKNLHLGHFVLSFLLVGIVSSLPEGSISLISAFKGITNLGFGTLIGSVVVDLTLVIGLVAIVARKTRMTKGLTYELWIFALMSLLFALGIDGVLSRIDGGILLGGCIFFFYNLAKTNHIMEKVVHSDKRHLAKQLGIFAASALVVFISADFAVQFSTSFAEIIGIPLVVVGIVMLAIATSLPEAVFAITAASKRLAEVAIGELFGVIMIDGAFLIGVVALIHPIMLPVAEFATLAIFVLTAVALVTYFIRSDRMLTWKEGIFLIFFYIFFVVSQFSSTHLIPT